MQSQNPVQKTYYLHSDSNSEHDPSLLVIAFDSNPSQNILKRNPNMLTHILNCISSFGNSHLMQKPQNKLAVVACHHNESKFLYPEKTLETRQIDGQHEFFTQIEKAVKTNLAVMIRKAPKVSGNSESLLAGCLAMILCYITRVITYLGPEKLMLITKLKPIFILD